MSRPKLDRPNYDLTTRTGRRKWYVTWTDPVTGATRYHSTGLDHAHQGQGKPEPCEAAKAYLSTFVADQGAPGADPTIGDLLDKRMAYWKGKKPRSKKALGTMECLHKMAKEYFGHLTAPQVTPDKVSGYTAHRAGNTLRRDRKVPLTAITRELEEVRSAMVYGVANKWIDEAPKLEMPDPRPPRDEVMTREHAQALIKAARRAHLKLFMQIALTTGRRKGAILDLTWDRVDLDRGMLNFNDPDVQQNNKRRGVCQVPRGLVIELQRMKKLAKTPYVIEFRKAKVGDVKIGFQAAAIEAKLYRVVKIPGAAGGKVRTLKKAWATPHVCKHSFISWMAEENWSVDKIAEYTDTDEKTVKRIYRKFNPSYLSGITEAVGAIIFPNEPALVEAVNPTGGRINATRRKPAKSLKDNGASDGSRTHDLMDHNERKVCKNR